MSGIDVLRAIAPGMWWTLADAIVSDRGIRTCVSLRSGGSCEFRGQWATYFVEPHGIDVRQRGAVETATWDDVRGVRARCTPDVLAALIEASLLCKTGPEYRVPTLPVHLRPEGRDLSDLDDDAWRAAQIAEHERWRAEVYVPFWAHRRAAEAALTAAIDRALVEDMDLLDILAVSA